MVSYFPVTCLSSPLQSTTHFALFTRPRLSINTGTVKETRAQSTIEVKGPKVSTRNFYLQSIVNCSLYFLARILASQRFGFNWHTLRKGIDKELDELFSFPFLLKDSENFSKPLRNSNVFFLFIRYINFFHIFICLIYKATDWNYKL